VGIARDAFAAWLRAQRETRGVSLEDVARVTKIHLRTLERLEDARFDELPADVFVRGFIRNYARVVGLDAEDALQRYEACGVTPGPAAAARTAAMIQTVSSMAPTSAARARRIPEATPPAGVQPRTLRPSIQSPVAVTPVGVPTIVAVIAESVPVPQELASGSLQMPVAIPDPVVEAAPEPETSKKKGGKARAKKPGKSKGRRKGEPVVEAEAAIVAVDPSEIDIYDEVEIVFAPDPIPETPAPVIVMAPPSYRPRITGRAAVTPIPTLVIDDADPESAERERESRIEPVEKRSFLPAALRDSEHGGRQGGLTLAVIILLIVATLTLSYLMRRPSAGGEGITMSHASQTTVA
jgi:hypothetical protein